MFGSRPFTSNYMATLSSNPSDEQRSRTFRKALFWVHLTLGLFSGLVIALMSVTGIAIAFEDEMLAWADRKASSVEAPHAGAAPMEVEALIESVRAARPDFTISHVQISKEAGKAYTVRAGRDHMLYLNPYDGSVRESEAQGVQNLINRLEEWHRWLGLRRGQHKVGKLVTGVANLIFVGLCISGLYLWFPRRWALRALRQQLTLKKGAKGKARDFNWHNVFGFWSLPVLIVLAGSAVVISFQWGHRLPFLLMGETPPASRGSGMTPATVSVEEGIPQAPYKQVVSNVAAVFPDWQKMEIQLPKASAPTESLKVGVTVPDYMPSRANIPVELNPYSAEIIQYSRFQDRSPGMKLRTWLRFLHTGAAFGFWGKVVATLGCLAAVVLVYTGFALSVRRFWPKRRQES